MKRRWLAIFFAIALPLNLFAQTEQGPYARIAVLRPNDGKTVDFEAGYIRHLDWHRQARTLCLVWLEYLGRRKTTMVYVCNLWTQR